MIVTLLLTLNPKAEIFLIPEFFLLISVHLSSRWTLAICPFGHAETLSLHALARIALVRV